ncbi:unnamed protein product [Boreogadus saida]
MQTKLSWSVGEKELSWSGGEEELSWSGGEEELSRHNSVVMTSSWRGMTSTRILDDDCHQGSSLSQSHDGWEREEGGHVLYRVQLRALSGLDAGGPPTGCRLGVGCAEVYLHLDRNSH